MSPTPGETFQVGEPTGLDRTVDPPRTIYGRWHAARIGPGILCQAGSPDGSIWELGTGKVNCNACRVLLAQRTAA